nr:hypothetical protein [Tanacetum cinerariifolium]
KVPAVDPIIPSFRTELIDKAPVLQVQHHVSNRFKTPPVESMGDLSRVDGLILIKELKEVDTKLLSAPISNKIEAQWLFKRKVPVTKLASGFPPAEIILEMTLSSTLKASGNSLICRCGLLVVVVVVVIVVSVSSSASTMSGYMTSPLAVGAFGTTWSIMVEVAFRA